MEIESKEDLTQLILIEQFKNGLPDQIATYISDVAILADDYALIHKPSFSEHTHLEMTGEHGVVRL